MMAGLFGNLSPPPPFSFSTSVLGGGSLSPPPPLAPPSSHLDVKKRHKPVTVTVQTSLASSRLFFCFFFGGQAQAHRHRHTRVWTWLATPWGCWGRRLPLPLPFQHFFTSSSLISISPILCFCHPLALSPFLFLTFFPLFFSRCHSDALYLYFFWIFFL